MIPIEQAHLQAASRTHPGMSGKNNEDRYLVSAFRWEDAQRSPAAVQSVLAVVSDGIGGHRAGEVAAEIAVQTIVRTISAAGLQHPPAQTLREAILQASQAVYNEAESHPEYKGMGATCACAWVVGDRLYTANVGDSRIYLLRGEHIQQVSIDHTWIQEALESGALTPEQARGHSNAHVIRRYLGSRNPVTPDLRLRLHPNESAAQSEANQGLRLAAGDRVILCSDGLTDLVEEAEILAVLRKFALEQALDELVALANARGGHDNITILAVQMPELVRQALPARPAAAATPTVPLPRPQPARKWYLYCLWLALALLAGSLALAGVVWVSNQVDVEPTPTVSATRPFLTALPELNLTVTATFSGQPAAPTRTPLGAPGTTPGTPAVTGSPRPIGSPRPTGAAATLTPWPTNTRPAP